MISTIGARSAIAAKNTRDQFDTSRRKWSATRISMRTACGGMIPNMAKCGFPRRCLSAGLRITMVIGRGFRPGAGLGWTTRLGVTRRSIMDVGLIREGLGAGYQVLSPNALYMRLHWSHLSAARISPWESRWVTARQLAGFL